MYEELNKELAVYFAANPHLDSPQAREIFRAGFSGGWFLRKKVAKETDNTDAARYRFLRDCDIHDILDEGVYKIARRMWIDPKVCDQRIDAEISRKVA